VAFWSELKRLEAEQWKDKVKWNISIMKIAVVAWKSTVFLHAKGTRSPLRSN
jgi:hypothetical protein